MRFNLQVFENGHAIFGFIEDNLVKCYVSTTLTKELLSDDVKLAELAEKIYKEVSA